jgi:hypothetical protein
MMAEPGTELVDAVAREREVHLTTYGRITGKPHRVTIWAGTDGKDVYVRSGQGMRRHWPQNLMARGEGVLQVGRITVKVEPRHVTDPAEARAVSALYKKKYGSFVTPSKPTEPLNLGEQATFELVPVEPGD